MKGSGRKKRALDDIEIIDGTWTADGYITEQQITVNNSFNPNYEDIEILYTQEKSPICVGLIYEVDPDDQVEKLQWREKECSRAQNVMCEVDFRNTQRYRD